eukprot:7390692-Prymnesium_polylepis.2
MGEVSEHGGGDRASTRRGREDMGKLIIVPELVFDDERFCWLLLGAKQVRCPATRTRGCRYAARGWEPMPVGCHT